MSNNNITNMCVTINNPMPEDYERLRELSVIARYAVAANEVGESGTPHIQAYVALTRNNKKRWAGWKKALPGAHLEVRVGSEKRASDYCKKGEQPKEEWAQLHELGLNFGLNADVWMETGLLDHRGLDGTLASIGRAMVDGEMFVQEAAMEYPETYIRFHRGLESLEQRVVPERSADTPKEVHVWVGPTGCGKSMHARSLCVDPYVWGPHMKDWFQKYRYQKHVILEEFRGQLPFDFMLILLDRYGMQVMNKGGSVEFLADVIHITSPIHPGWWYSAGSMRAGDDVDQLYRRLTTVNVWDPDTKSWQLDTELFSCASPRDGVC
uniref:Replication-associated protein n=1 Tax=Diporeia sp. associated circular virus TaxID=1299317 RepID=M1TG61_9VIRU|nr:replication-associated protein [Diporeia sp. associated circular virus]